MFEINHYDASRTNRKAPHLMITPDLRHRFTDIEKLWEEHDEIYLEKAVSLIKFIQKNDSSGRVTSAIDSAESDPQTPAKDHRFLTA